MQLIALHRWHWIVIALVLGVIVGAARENVQGEIYGNYVSGFGYQLTDQYLFEKAVVDDFHGNKRFKDITVYPRWILDAHGSRKLVYIVSGLYWSGHEELVNGAPVATFHPTCFIAPTPYKPRIDLSAYNKQGGANFTALFREGGRQHTVRDFLDVVHAAADVNYTYAWWDEHPIVSATLLSLLIIGGVWPTFINLMAFGTLTRPPEAKGLSLWRTSSKTAPKPIIAAPVHAAAPMSEIERELEAALMSPATAATETASGTSRLLSSAPLEPAAPAARGPGKEFGADREDFYPTERRKPTRNSG